VFGSKKKMQLLNDVAERNRALLKSDKLDDLQRGAREIRTAWSDAGFPWGDAVDVAREIEARIEQILRRPFEERLRPCRNCEGRLFRISSERSVEGVGNVRIAGCEGCGAMTWFWLELPRMREWGSVVAVSDGSSGPFR
jgi:hypothetical protein